MSTIRYVALLRGINVGGNKKVQMKDLKSVFEALQFANVSTYINSGNILFETSKKVTPATISTIEKALQKTFGFEIKIVVRDSASIQNLNKKIPAAWQNDTEQKTDVLFLWKNFDKKSTVGLLATKPGIDHLLYVPGAIVWNIDRKNYNKSGMHKFIGTVVYKNMTARNINTVRKLAGLMTEK